ncbi:hypothetical protein O2K51_07995 [Apibacter raozihei]|uniref:hypothetical protein n=1 Tax=Apibacter raozihei TaxID=2500547 RepID=UPI000FE2EF17|nr:hypothetical protein [Apibacter raozihei]
MKKKDPEFWKEAKESMETIRKNRHNKNCLMVEMESYTDLGCLLSALIRISQQSLFLKEELVDEEIRTDIYNLLDFANKLIPFPELELLDEISTISR